MLILEGLDWNAFYQFLSNTNLGDVAATLNFDQLLEGLSTVNLEDCT